MDSATRSPAFKKQQSLPAPDTGGGRDDKYNNEEYFENTDQPNYQYQSNSRPRSNNRLDRSRAPFRSDGPATNSGQGPEFARIPQSDPPQSPSSARTSGVFLVRNGAKLHSDPRDKKEKEENKSFYLNYAPDIVHLMIDYLAYGKCDDYNKIEMLSKYLIIKLKKFPKDGVIEILDIVTGDIVCHLDGSFYINYESNIRYNNYILRIRCQKSMIIKNKQLEYGIHEYAIKKFIHDKWNSIEFINTIDANKMYKFLHKCVSRYCRKHNIVFKFPLYSFLKFCLTEEECLEFSKLITNRNYYLLE
jgi:hypothetical protein